MDKKTAMENLARKAHEKGVFNGTWLYAENGQIISKGAFGFRDAEDKLPMQEDSIFEMASITKQFTAAAVMLLVREGKLRLDDEYTKFFHEYPYQGVTIRHLLTHTSGMPDDFETADWVAPILEKENRIPACSEILRFICESGEAASCAPGEKYRYTDVGYCLIANVVEKVSGIRFEDFLKKNLFEPAGMKDTAILHTRRDGRPSDRFTRNMVLENDSYEWEDYRIDIQLKDNGLFAIISLKDKEEPEVKLFPIGEKTFALKTDTSDMVFVDGGLTLYGIEGKKTE